MIRVKFNNLRFFPLDQKIVRVNRDTLNSTNNSMLLNNVRMFLVATIKSTYASDVANSNVKWNALARVIAVTKR